MRILLQQKETGLYLQDVAEWTCRSAEARDFLSSTVAIEFCLSNRLKGLQVVLKFEEERFDIVFPISPVPGTIGAGPSEQRLTAS